MQKHSSKWLITLLAGTLLTFSIACKDKPNTTQNDTKSTEAALNTNENVEKPEATEKPAENTENTESDSSFSSGVDKSKKINALTEEEKQQLLDATNNHVPLGMTKEQLDLAMCSFGATISLGPTLEQLTTDEMLQQACTQARDMCLEHLTETKQEMDISIFPPDCEATVAETETCLGAQNKHGAKFLKEFPPCDKLTLQIVKDPTLFAGVEALNNAPPECAPLAEKCPGFLTSPQ